MRYSLRKLFSNTFEGHRGIPGKQGGSLPRSGGARGGADFGDPEEIGAGKARTGGFTKIDLGSGNRDTEQMFESLAGKGSISNVKIAGNISDIGGKTVEYIELSPSGKYSVVSYKGKSHSISNSDIVAYRTY